MSQIQKKFRCTFCQKRYSNRNALNYHINVVNDKKKALIDVQKDAAGMATSKDFICFRICLAMMGLVDCIVLKEY